MSSINQPESDNITASKPVERRRHVRFPFSATVEAIENESGAKVAGRTTELGMGGCYVETLSPFPVGAELKIRILRGNERFEAHARVVYGLIGMGMGLAFVSAQPKHVKLFQRWMQELSGQSAPAPGAPVAAPAHKTQALKNVVMNDLIMTLMQKNVLTEREGKDLLKMLSDGRPEPIITRSSFICRTAWRSPGISILLQTRL